MNKITESSPSYKAIRTEVEAKHDERQINHCDAFEEGLTGIQFELKTLIESDKALTIEQYRNSLELLRVLEEVQEEWLDDVRWGFPVSFEGETI